MQAMLISLLYTIARRIFDKDLFDRVEYLVKSLLNEDLSGDEKRKRVQDTVVAEWAEVKKIVIDTIIQVVLVKEVGTGE